MSKKYEIRNNKGEVTGTVAPANTTSSAGPSSPAGDVIGMLLLAAIVFLAGSMITVVGGGFAIAVVIKLTGGDVGTAFYTSAGLAWYGGAVFGLAYLVWAITVDVGTKKVMQGVGSILLTILLLCLGIGILWWLFVD